MPSKYGGVELHPAPSGSKYGGIPLETDTSTPSNPKQEQPGFMQRLGDNLLHISDPVMHPIETAKGVLSTLGALGGLPHPDIYGRGINYSPSPILEQMSNEGLGSNMADLATMAAMGMIPVLGKAAKAGAEYAGPVGSVLMDHIPVLGTGRKILRTVEALHRAVNPETEAGKSWSAPPTGIPRTFVHGLEEPSAMAPPPVNYRQQSAPTTVAPPPVKYRTAESFEPVAAPPVKFRPDQVEKPKVVAPPPVRFKPVEEMDVLGGTPESKSTLPPADPTELNRMVHAHIQGMELPGSPAGQRSPGTITQLSKDLFEKKSWADVSLEQRRSLMNWLLKNPGKLPQAGEL